MAWAVLFPNCQTEQVLREICTACFAQRRTEERGLWVYGRRVIQGRTPVAVEAGSSPHLEAILGAGHEHQWRFESMGYSFLGIGNGVGCGTPGFNPVASAIRHNQVKCAAVEACVAAGEFRREEVVAILELPPVPTVKDRQDPARLHLFRRGQDLLRSVECEAAGAWPGVAETVHPADCPCQRKR